MRQKANTLKEMSREQPYYISRDHLIGELNTILSRWNKNELLEDRPYKLIICCMKNYYDHCILIRPFLHHKVPIRIDVEQAVDNLIDFAHNGDYSRLHECEYEAALLLFQSETLEEMKNKICKLDFDQADIDCMINIVSPKTDCPECKGTGQYIGFNKIEPCSTCGVENV